MKTTDDLRARELARNALTLKEKDASSSDIEKALAPLVEATHCDEEIAWSVMQEAADASSDSDALAVFRAARWRRDLPKALVGAAWNDEAPDRQWLVDNWLPLGELAMLTGRGETGKGLLGLQLGAALACDRDPLCHAGGWLPTGSAIEATAPALCTEPVTVVIAGWEDDRYEMLRRRHRLATSGGCGWASHPSVNDRLHVLSMRGFGPVWAPPKDDRFGPGELTRTGFSLLEYCEHVKARLVLIDPVGLALALEENDRTAVSAALDELAGWVMRTGCTVLLVGHPAKATVGEAADYSGSTAWRGCVRAMLTLRSPSEKAIEANSAEWQKLKGTKGWELVSHLQRNKSNYGPSGDVLTIATCSGASGWYLTDPLEEPSNESKGRAKGRRGNNKPRNQKKSSTADEQPWKPVV